PLAVDVQPGRVEAAEEDDDRPIDARGRAVDVRLRDPYPIADVELEIDRRFVLVEAEERLPGGVGDHRGYLLVTGQGGLEQLVRACHPCHAQPGGEDAHRQKNLVRRTFDLRTAPSLIGRTST